MHRFNIHKFKKTDASFFICKYTGHTIKFIIHKFSNFFIYNVPKYLLSKINDFPKSSWV